MTSRHLTQDEKTTIKTIVEDAGPAEVLRLLATLVANTIEDVNVAAELRTDILIAAKNVKLALTKGKS